MEETHLNWGECYCARFKDNGEITAMARTKTTISSSEQAREMGKKSKRGKSLRHEIIRQFNDAECDRGEVIKEWIEQSKTNAAYAKLIIENESGKVPDKMELTGQDGEPIQNEITIKFVKPKKK